jgi:Zn-dependent protease
MGTIPQYIAFIVVLLVAFPVHEFAHAFAADRLGDDTPRLNGRLTLNPLAHLDLMGSIMLIVAGFGWAKPVPVDPYALRRRSPAALMLVALAGPMSNFLMAILTAIVIRTNLFPFMYPTGSLLPPMGYVLDVFFTTNLVLMLFNLIPLAPLDGDKVADYFLPPSWARVMDKIRPYGPIILLVIVFGGRFTGINILNEILSIPLENLRQILLGVYA